MLAFEIDRVETSLIEIDQGKRPTEWKQKSDEPNNPSNTLFGCVLSSCSVLAAQKCGREFFMDFLFRKV
jgi:hypothetical protein